MRSAAIALSGAVVVAAVGASGIAVAAKRRAVITATLAEPGYALIAVAADGRARAATGPRVRLAPPAATVTLHLRDPKGRYAGPVVVGDGKPIGAGRLGLVRATPSRAGGDGRDLDRDGVVGAFDVDDDGDLQIDNVDRTPSPRARAAVIGRPSQPYWVINAGLQVSYLAAARGIPGVAGYAVNRNAAGPFAASGAFAGLVDVLMQERGELFFPRPPEGATLDCTGLTYCAHGGTGALSTRDRKFPEAVNPDANGFGSMVAVDHFAEGQDGLGTLRSTPPAQLFGLAPRAPRSQIAAGDTFVVHLADGDHQAVTLNEVFGTLPALTWHSVDGSNGLEIAWTVEAVTMSVGRMGPIVYQGHKITGGTPPPGYTCEVKQLSAPSDHYACQGTLPQGQKVSGRIIDSALSATDVVDLLACKEGSDDCRGYGLVRE